MRSANVRAEIGAKESIMKNLPPDPIEHSAIKKIAIWLVPFIALMFFINYLDHHATA
jgi:hypothetical protein